MSITDNSPDEQLLDDYAEHQNIWQSGIDQLLLTASTRQVLGLDGPTAASDDDDENSHIEESDGESWCEELSDDDDDFICA